MDKRERFDDIFRDRLYDVEYDPTEMAWEGIAAQLPRRRFMHKWMRRVVAVAALLLLVAGSGMLFLWHENKEEASGIVMADHLVQPVSSMANEDNTILYTEPLEVGELTLVVCKKGEKEGEQRTGECVPVSVVRDSEPLLHGEELPVKLVDNTRVPFMKKLPRKWRIGVGSGGIGIAGVSLNNYNDLAPTQDMENPVPQPDDQDKPLLSRATSTPRYEPEKSVRVKHLMPVSFGISLSYPLSERWSFQTGLTYTYSRSKWKKESSNRVVQKQSLHFLGIPISVNCRLTNWQRPYCYFNAGILAEVNIAGHLKNSYGHESIRIPGLLWTSYARVGVAYPLIRFISVYAEGGMCYYFDYKGTIETVRSEHAFNFTGQLGIRFSF